MSSLVYRFDDFSREGSGSYICQLVRKRRLTDIPHRHDFYEIVYILRGGAIQSVNGKRVEMTENTLTLLRPSDVHFFLSQTENLAVVSLSVRSEELYSLCAVFEPELSARIDGEAQPRLVTGSPILAYLSPERADSLYGEGEYDRKLLLLSFIRSYLESESGAPEADSVERAMAGLRSDEELRCGVDALVKASGYSRSHLARLVRERYGVSLKKHINELRLSRAYSELLLTDKCAEEIAEQVGFQSFSHFSKIFKERYGRTPASVRRGRHGII